MKKYRDDICRIGKCANVDVCKGLCPALKYVNGKSKSKEILLSNLINTDNLEYKDYKAELSELAQDREIKEQTRIEKLERLLAEPNTRDKFIKLALLAGYNQSEVAVHFHLTRGRICQIIKKAP